MKVIVMAERVKWDMRRIEKQEIYRMPSLLNAGAAADFLYTFKDASSGLIFVRAEDESFSRNLRKLDTDLPEILSKALLDCYRSGVTRCRDIMNRLEAADPLGLRLRHAYEVKMKKFLAAAALGLHPAGGTDRGCIILTEGGEKPVDHLYGRHAFWKYLADHTRFIISPVWSKTGDCLRLRLTLRFDGI